MKKYIVLLLITLLSISALLCLTACNDSVTTASCTHNEEIIPAKAATCTENGLTDGKKCSLCGVILVEQKLIDALGHREETLPAIEPSCTKDGLTSGKKCSVCQTVTVEQITVPKKAHNIIDIPAVEPTCTKEGLTSGKKCSECQIVTVEQTIVPKKAHNIIDIPAVEPTCTEDGLTSGKKCSECQTVTVEQNSVPARGHKIFTLKAVEPTCTEAGLTSGKKCFVCNEIIVKQAVIPKKAHMEVLIPAVESTCTKTGLTQGMKCSECQTVTVPQNVIPMKPHTVGEWIDETAPICGESGAIGHYTCSKCKSNLDYNLNLLPLIAIPPKENHNYTEWSIVKEGGCSAISFNVRICQKCNHCDISTDDADFTNPHEFKLLTKEPTLTKAGYEYRYECEICHTVGAEKIIPSSVYEQSRWKGKKWCAIGDSITIRYGNYVDTVAKALGLEATNLGISGADARRMRLSFSGEDVTHIDYTPERRQAVIDADIITIYGFANDYYPGAPAIGDLYNSAEGTYAYNVKALIEAVLELNPTAKIVIIGCHNIWDYYRPDIYEPVTGENRIADYIDMLDEIANYYGLPFIDMYHDSGINEFSAPYFLADGCHPTPAGYERISEILIQRLLIV